MSGIIDKVSSYFEARLELFKLEFKEEAAVIIAKISVVALISLIFLFALFLLSVAASVYIGEYLDKIYLGYLITGGFYLLIMILLLIFRNKIDIEKMVRNVIEKAERSKKNE